MRFVREEHFDDVVAKEVVEDVLGGEGDDKHGTTITITITITIIIYYPYPLKYLALAILTTHDMEETV